MNSHSFFTARCTSKQAYRILADTYPTRIGLRLQALLDQLRLLPEVAEVYTMHYPSAGTSGLRTSMYWV